MDLRLRQDHHRLVVGVMSGTSLDGVDLCLCHFSTTPSSTSLAHLHKVLAFETVPIPDALRSAIQQLLSDQARTISTATTPSICVLDLVCRTNVEWSKHVGAMINDFIERFKTDFRRRRKGRDVAATEDDTSAAIVESLLAFDDDATQGDRRRREQQQQDTPSILVASHGQTVWHVSGHSTLQIGDGETLCRIVGRPVVSNFRLGDVAVGGTGAPLVPFFDRFLFAQQREEDDDRDKAPSLFPAAFLNLGGISNVTYFPNACADLVAVDTGPANVVLNEIVELVNVSPAGNPFCQQDGGDTNNTDECALTRFARGLEHVQRGEESVESALKKLQTCDYCGFYSSQSTVDFDKDKDQSEGEADHDDCEFHELLRKWMEHPYVHAVANHFQRQAAKCEAGNHHTTNVVSSGGTKTSTGREDFGQGFVRATAGPLIDRIADTAADPSATQRRRLLSNLCRTAVEFTCRSICHVLQPSPNITLPAKDYVYVPPRRVYVSGGGAQHPVLLARLRELLSRRHSQLSKLSEAVVTTRDKVVLLSREPPPPTAAAADVATHNNGFEGFEFGDAKEAVAFALLGYLRHWSVFGVEKENAEGVGAGLVGQDGTNEPGATGARRRVFLGQLSLP